MAWNEPGGDRDPWGGKNNQDGPPDLDEVVRRIQQRLGQWFGGSGGGSGGGGGGPRLFGVGVILILVLGVWLLSGFYIVNPAERGVVLRFGQYQATTTEGPRWHLPFPIERAEKVNVDSIRTTTHKGLMLTRDENIVNVELAVQYRIGDAYSYLFKIRDPEATLRDAMISAVREVVGQSDMDFILGAGRSEVATRTQALLQNTIDYYEAGLVVTSVNLQDAQPPEQVQSAFEDAIKAREDKQRIINEADAYANSILPQARGAAARAIQEAEAYRERAIAEADGQADRFLAMQSEYKMAPDITRERLYMETMEEVLANSLKVLVNTTGENNVLYLPLDRMIGQAGGRVSGADNGRFTVPMIDNSDIGDVSNRDTARSRGRR